MALGHVWISSRNSSVLPGRIRFPASSSRAVRILRTSKSRSKMTWYRSFSSKLISTSFQTVQRNDALPMSCRIVELREEEAASDSIPFSRQSKLHPYHAECTRAFIHFKIANRILHKYFKKTDRKKYFHLDFAKKKYSPFALNGQL